MEGIVEDGGAGWTCWRSIGDWYLTSHQNVNMNLVSQSDTIDLGTPWSLTISLRNTHATSLAVTCIVIGARCTCDMS